MQKVLITLVLLSCGDNVAEMPDAAPDGPSPAEAACRGVLTGECKAYKECGAPDPVLYECFANVTTKCRVTTTMMPDDEVIACITAIKSHTCPPSGYEPTYNAEALACLGTWGEP